MAATPAQAARTEFKEMSMRELQEYEAMFLAYDQSKDGHLDMMELKYMMEKLECPQTHLGLKAMIKEVDEDLDGKIVAGAKLTKRTTYRAYREFLLIFRYAKTGQLQNEGLKSIVGHVSVDEVGVGGAKGFFEKKAAALNDDPAARDAAWREEKKKAAAAKQANKAAFKDKMALFK